MISCWAVLHSSKRVNAICFLEYKYCLNINTSLSSQYQYLLFYQLICFWDELDSSIWIITLTCLHLFERRSQKLWLQRKCCLYPNTLLSYNIGSCSHMSKFLFKLCYTAWKLRKSFLICTCLKTVHQSCNHKEYALSWISWLHFHNIVA